MNPNHQKFWSNFIQIAFGNSPSIPSQPNASSFENASNISNPQNNQHFKNYPYHTSPNSYQQFSSQSNTSPYMPLGIQMGSSGVQLNDQEHETPQVFTQGGLEAINQRRVNFSFNHGSIFQRIQLLALIKKEIVFGRGFVKLITTTATRIFQRGNQRH